MKLEKHDWALALIAIGMNDPDPHIYQAAVIISGEYHTSTADQRAQFLLETKAATLRGIAQLQALAEKLDAEIASGEVQG